jgi:hypothetical protein
MNLYPMNDTTRHRRRLSAQQWYIEMIDRGVFNHDRQKAVAVLNRLRAPAILEAVAYLFVKNAR